MKLDTDKAQTLGIPVTDVYNSLQTFLGGLYVNDFNRFGRTWQVLLQAEPEFRDRPSDISRYYVRTGTNNMVPLFPRGYLLPLLERRPDIRQAELQLIAANANNGTYSPDSWIWRVCGAVSSVVNLY